MDIVSKLRDCAIYWGDPVTQGSGAIIFNPPKVIRCRWQDVQEKFFSNQGEEKFSRAMVHVEEDMDGGGYLFHGELLTPPADPTTVRNAFPIQLFLKSPNIANLQWNRRCYI